MWLPAVVTVIVLAATPLFTATLTPSAVAPSVKCTVPGTALQPGSRPLTLVYAGSANAAGSQTAKTLVIGKAVAKVTNTLAAATIRKTAHGKITVKVTAPGTTPGGKVAIFDGTKQIATGTLSGGAVTVTLPLLSVGKHTLHAKYLGSSLVGSASAANVTLTVTR